MTWLFSDHVAPDVIHSGAAEAAVQDKPLIVVALWVFMSQVPRVPGSTAVGINSAEFRAHIGRDTRV